MWLQVELKRTKLCHLQKLILKINLHELIEVEIGDILLAKMKDTDKVLLINEDNENYIYSTGFFTIKPDTNIVNTEYIYHVLKSDYFQGEKNKLAKGATQKALNNAGLKKIKIPVPSKTKQEKIVNALKM